MGAMEVSKDSYWLENRYGFENLLRHLDSKVEKYLTRSGPTSPESAVKGPSDSGGPIGKLVDREPRLGDVTVDTPILRVGMEIELEGNPCTVIAIRGMREVDVKMEWNGDTLKNQRVGAFNIPGDRAEGYRLEDDPRIVRYE